jgi:hypothetical protein
VFFLSVADLFRHPPSCLLRPQLELGRAFKRQMPTADRLEQEIDGVGQQDVRLL